MDHQRCCRKESTTSIRAADDPFSSRVYFSRNNPSSESTKTPDSEAQAVFKGSASRAREDSQSYRKKTDSVLC